MWNKLGIGLLAGIAAVVFCGCAAVQAERHAEEVKQQRFVTRVDLAHVWVTPATPGPGKPYTVLGPVKYTVPFSPDAIDAQHESDKLKAIAYKKWPDQLDALIQEKESVSPDASKVTVSAEAIQYASSTNRQALHDMNNGLVVSPSGD